MNTIKGNFKIKLSFNGIQKQLLFCIFLLTLLSSTAQINSIDSIVKASSYGDKYVWSYSKDSSGTNLLPWAIFKPNEFGSAKIVFDSVGVKDLGNVPGAGIHPRMFFSNAELPALRNRLKNTRAGQEAWKNVLEYANALKLTYNESADYAKPDWMGGSFQVHGRCPLFRIGGYKNREDYYTELANGKVPTKQYPWMQAMSVEALRCVIDNDSTGANKLIKATITAIGIEQYRRDTTDKAVAVGQPPNPSTNRLFAIALGFIYDFTYNFMDTSQQRIIRDELITESAWQDNYGTFNHPENSRSNWAGFSYWVFDLMALEGDKGFNDLKFRGLYRGLRNFYNTSFFEAGTDYEGEGKLLFAMDAVTTYDRVAEKYGLEKLSHHPLVRKNLSNFTISSVLPTLRNFVIFDILGGMGKGVTVPLDVLVAHYLYPNDKKIDFIYRVTVADDYSSLPNRVDNLVNGVIISALYATDYDSTINPDNLNLPKTFFCGQRSLMMTRSSWDTMASFLTMHTRGASGGHPYIDRNGIMLAGKGRPWVTIPVHGGETAGWKCDIVEIDGRDQDNSTPARMVDFVDSSLATFAVGDAKYSWDWSWRRIDNNIYGKQATFADATNGTIGIGYGYKLVDQSFNDFAYTKSKDLKYQTALKTFPHWLNVEGTISADAKQPSTPVLKAFRTSGIVRGKNPYVLVIDDIQHNKLTSTYDWNLNLMPDLKMVKTLPKNAQSGDFVFTDSNSINKDGSIKTGASSLLIRVLQANGKISPATLIVRESQNIFTYRSIATSPDFKIMLFPFIMGDSLPKTTWDTLQKKLSIAFSNQLDSVYFTPDSSGKTNLQIVRGGNTIVKVNNPVSKLIDPDTDQLDSLLVQEASLVPVVKNYDVANEKGLSASWSFENYNPLDSSYKANQAKLNLKISAKKSTSVSGIKGLGVRFDTLGVSVPYSSTAKTLDSLSFSFWVKADTNTTGTIANFGVLSGFQMDYNQGIGRFSAQGKWGIGNFNVDVMGGWTNFVVTYDTNWIKLYRDAILLMKIPVKTKFINAKSFILGTKFNGLYDELNVFNRCLDSATIMKMYLSTYYQFTSSLPLKLLSFSGVKKNNYNLLNWQTVYEQNVENYKIQKSLTPTLLGFKTIGEVSAKNNAADNYNYIDTLNAVDDLQGYYYRIVSKDKDGGESYSPLVFIDALNRDALKIYPNPAQNQLNIVGTKITAVNIYGINGQLLRQYLTGSTNNANLNLYNLPKGNYLVEAYYGAEKKTVSKVVVE